MVEVEFQFENGINRVGNTFNERPARVRSNLNDTPVVPSAAERHPLGVSPMSFLEACECFLGLGQVRRPLELQEEVPLRHVAFPRSMDSKRPTDPAMYSSRASTDSQRRLCCSAAAPVVLLPAKGSRTRDRGSVRNLMKKLGRPIAIL